MIWLDYLISGILAFILLSVGLSLRKNDFIKLRDAPQILFIGMILQLVVLPLIAFAVATAWNLPPAFKAGIIILAATPGGMSSNFLSYILKANTALAVSLTICNSLVTMFTVPLIVNLGLSVFYGSADLYTLPFWETAGRIFTIVLVPVSLGVAYRAYYPKNARRLQLWFRWTSMVLLAGVFAIKAFAPTESGGSALTIAEVTSILPASLTVNFLALFTGWAVGSLMGFSRNDQLTMGVEIGIQNTSLAFLIAATLIGNEDMLKPALIYATFSFFTALLYGLLLKPRQWSVLKRELREIIGLLRI